MSISRKLKNAASGSADGGGGGGGSAGGYVDDVFSTYVYEGNSDESRDIENGIDLAGKGGMVWHKKRTGNNENHYLYDTERGPRNRLNSNNTSAEGITTGGLIGFNSNGFTHGRNQETGDTYASWTFRKERKFFDIVHQTIGNTTATIPHNLGSMPGCIIRKKVDSTQNWFVWHRKLTDGHLMYLDLTLAEDSSPGINTVTDTSFKFSGAAGEYVFYIFAHNDGDGGFGEDGNQDIIKCGSYASTSATPLSVSLGWEPQWVLIKAAGGPGDWFVFDTMRGIVTDGNDRYLSPNSSSAEAGGANFLSVNPDGFSLNLVNAGVNGNGSGSKYIYVAIRRPMKTPESGTEVFGVNSYSETNDHQQLTTGNLVDLGWQYLNGDGAKFFTRLLGQGYLNPTSTAATNTSAASAFDFMDGFEPHYANNVSGFSPRVVYGFTRAPGFFDVVAYEGDSQLFKDYSHNLGVVPELIILKCRNSDPEDAAFQSNFPADWFTAVKDPSKGDEYGGHRGALNLSDELTYVKSNWNGHTDTTFRPSLVTAKSGVGGGIGYFPGNDYVAYLFASVPGISKVGSYTGTGAEIDVDCGFTTGARFVLIKRTDDTGDWYVWDTERGIVAGNDPYLLLNETAAQVTNTDYIDPLSSGFKVTASAPDAINASGGEYIFYAIA